MLTDKSLRVNDTVQCFFSKKLKFTLEYGKHFLKILENNYNTAYKEGLK